MKSTSYIVDVARANILQEEPLYRALKEEWIVGATLDVWWLTHWWSQVWNPGGQTPNCQIWKLPTVIATLHNIGSTDEHADSSLIVIAENIR